MRFSISVVAACFVFVQFIGVSSAANTPHSVESDTEVELLSIHRDALKRKVTVPGPARVLQPDGSSFPDENLSILELVGGIQAQNRKAQYQYSQMKKFESWYQNALGAVLQYKSQAARKVIEAYESNFERITLKKFYPLAKFINPKDHMLILGKRIKVLPTKKVLDFYLAAADVYVPYRARYEYYVEEAKKLDTKYQYIVGQIIHENDPRDVKRSTYKLETLGKIFSDSFYQQPITNLFIDRSDWKSVGVDLKSGRGNSREVAGSRILFSFVEGKLYQQLEKAYSPNRVSTMQIIKERSEKVKKQNVRKKGERDRRMGSKYPAGFNGII